MQYIKETMTISEIIELKKGDILKVNPEYQRGAVWTQRQESLLIDSILRGYPIPMFYFHKKTSVAGKFITQTLYIIDGQQRINAIFKFYNDEFPLPDPQKHKKSGIPKFLAGKDYPWGGKTFSSLSEKLKKQFESILFYVSIIETEDDNEVRDLFIRLQAGLPLNAQEKRDAWPGKFSDFIINIAGKQGLKSGHDFFRKLLSGTGGKRGGVKARQACAQIFMTYYTRKKYCNPYAFIDLSSQQVDEFYRHNLDFNPRDPDSYAERFKKILDIAFELLGTWKGPPLKFHVALHLILLIDTLLDDFTNDWKGRFPTALKNFLHDVQKATSKKDLNDEYYQKYGAWISTAAASKNVINKRHQFFSRKMLWVLRPKRRDLKRNFTYAERELLYYSSDGMCAICAEKVNWEDTEAHHVKPHTDGGETLLKNAQLVHSKCHPRGTGSYGAGITEEVPYEIEDEDIERRAIRRPAKRIKLSDLYAKGLLKDGTNFIFQTKERKYSAKFKAPDTLFYNGTQHKGITPSKALGELVGYPINGWAMWQVETPEGRLIELSDLRDQLNSLYSSESNDDLLEDD